MQSSTAGNAGYDSYNSQPEDLTIETTEPSPSHHTFPPVSFHSTFPDVYLPPSIPNQTTASSFVPFSFLDSHVDVEVPATLTLGTTHSSNDLLTTQTPSVSNTHMQSLPSPGSYDHPVSLVAKQPHISVSKSFSQTPGINTHTTPSVTVNNPGFVSPPKPTASCMSTMQPSGLKYLLLSPGSGQKSAIPSSGAGDGVTATLLLNGVPTRMVLLDTKNKADQSEKGVQKASAASLTAAQLHLTAMSQTAGWDPEEEPLYVNGKQYHRIMKRREMRAKLEASGKIPKTRKKYLYESRHKHAMARARGNGGKFSKEN